MGESDFWAISFVYGWCFCCGSLCFPLFLLLLSIKQMLIDSLFLSFVFDFKWKENYYQRFALWRYCVAVEYSQCDFTCTMSSISVKIAKCERLLVLDSIEWGNLTPAIFDLPRFSIMWGSGSSSMLTYHFSTVKPKNIIRLACFHWYIIRDHVMQCDRFVIASNQINLISRMTLFYWWYCIFLTFLVRCGFCTKCTESSKN